MAQQKQCKQLILIDSKNTFTCRFQPMQRLQHIFMTDSIRNFTYTKHNRKQHKNKNIVIHTATTTHATQSYD